MSCPESLHVCGVRASPGQGAGNIDANCQLHVRSSANALAGVVLLQVKGAEDLEAGLPRSASAGGGGGLMAAASAKRREVVSQVGHI